MSRCGPWGGVDVGGTQPDRPCCPELAAGAVPVPVEASWKVLSSVRDAETSAWCTWGAAGAGRGEGQGCQAGLLQPHPPYPVALPALQEAG